MIHFRGGSMTAGEIAARFACSWPTTSRHLRILEEAGLVLVEEEGRHRHYRLERERLERTVGGWLHAFQMAPRKGAGIMPGHE